MPIFIVNPIRNSLNYFTAREGLVTKVLTTVNTQSEEIFMSADSDFVNSIY